MTAALILRSSACLLCLASLLPHVEGVEARGQPYDLQIQQVSRVVTRVDDDLMMTVTVDFTASTQPQTEWTYAGPDHGTAYLTEGTQVTFSEGVGQAIATSRPIFLLFLKIGDFDRHTLELFIRFGFPFNTTQTLNTVLTSVSPGYDITYSHGESFQVTASVPRNVADNFNWSPKPLSEGLDLRLKSCYMDQNTRRVLSSVDYLRDPNTSRFLKSNITYGDQGANWELNFTTARRDINGYFRFFTFNEHISYRDDSPEKFIEEIWERVDVRVHNGSTPGPFPVGYAYIKSSPSSKDCTEGEKCRLYCYGFANDIDDVSIVKDGGGPAGTLQTSFRNSDHVLFQTSFTATGDFTGNYTCRLRSRDGATASATVRVY
ncbi:uncharacterized protein LOC143290273 [Babylonia areolata]|uniref:uncharacterized protein LOC143290273 n=1 Tax=Babylonia areolata TaxID=304850 RepID=UPI003FD1061C